MLLKVRKGNISDFSLNLKPSAQIHIMGISGTAMSALAGLLQAQGYKVQGSDKNFYPPIGEELKKLNIPLTKGYRAENIHAGLDLVIVGNVISKHFPSAQALLKSQIPYMSLPEALNHFALKDKKSIMVCGTHGKTTVSCLSAYVLKECGLAPSFMIGGVAENFKKGFYLSQSPWFVLEGDEYDTAFFEKSPKFIHYHAHYVLLNNIEFDHADIYPDKNAVVQAFKLLIKKVKSTEAFLIANADCPITTRLTAGVQNKLTYGLQKGDWRLIQRDSLQEQGQILLVKNQKNKEKVRIQIPLVGEHNALNALAVWALSRAFNLDKEKTLLAFKKFLGVRRRFQILGVFSKRTLIEDFAHHPTAVRAVLHSAREMYPDRRIVAVFEPRSHTSRRAIFQKPYESALSQADVVFCMELDKTSLLPEKERFSAKELVLNISKMGKPAHFASSVEKLSTLVTQKSTQGDIIIMMSNGDFGGMIPLLKKALNKTGYKK